MSAKQYKDTKRYKVFYEVAVFLAELLFVCILSSMVAVTISVPVILFKLAFMGGL